MKLLILASGRGSRLKSKTVKIPKTLIKINKFSIFDYLKKKFFLFNSVIVVSGYKHKKLKLHKSKKCKIIFNKNYNTSNMVHSMFKAKNLVNSDIIVSYSDIIYSEKILKKMIKFNHTHIPININWLKNWKKRMSFSKIKNDAEDLTLDKKIIKSIGGKIIGSLPKYQYMGLIKLKKRDYFKLFYFYKKIKNEKIDMTSFLNKSIKEKIIKLKYFKTSYFWTEIDNPKDIKAAKYYKKLKYF